MKTFRQLINGISLTLYLLGLFYLIINNEYYSLQYSLNPRLIPTIAFLSIIYFGYRYTLLSINTDKLEQEFTTIINHAFRTPLTKVMWMTRELEKDMPQKDRAVFLQHITNGTSRVLDLVDLLAGIEDINDISGYVFQATSLREVVEKSISKYREDINNKNITFQISTFKDIPLLTVDLKKISFVIDTLIENAINYTPKEGKVLIDCLVKNGKLLLYVSDTGLGLNMIEKFRIFSKFYRGKNALLDNTDGMGLRLYLSSKIVARHNGRIYAKSKGRNKGTTFFVELPFNK